MHLPLQDYYYSRSSGPFSSFNRLRNSGLYTPAFSVSLRAGESLRYLQECFGRVAGQPALSQMLYVDTKTWLPDDLLLKADKMTMANSIELRVPLLDHQVLEFAASLPPHYKLEGSTTKRILKQALKARVPEQILNRKKTGFPVPTDSWICGNLRDFTRDVLLERRTVERGYFTRSAIEHLLDGAAIRGQGASQVFGLVALELWHRQFADGLELPKPACGARALETLRPLG